MPQLIGIRVPADNLRGPLYMEQALDALHTRNPRCRRVQLEIGRHGDEVMLYCRLPPALAPTFLQQLAASYPDAHVEQLPANALGSTGHRVYRRRLTLRPRCGAIRTWQTFQDRDERTLADPLAGILRAVNDEAFSVHVVLDLRPVRPRRHRRLRRAAARSRVASPKFDRHLFAVGLLLRVSAPRDQRRRARTVLSDIAAAFGRFTGGQATFWTTWWPRSFFLSTEELASLWHPPTQQTRTPKLAAVGSRSLPPPAALPTKRQHLDLAVIGRAGIGERSIPFGIRQEDRMRHLAVIGKTGMGKTTLLKNLIADDIAAGRGVALLDPHGDLAEAIADSVPPWRTNEVAYFDAGDRTHHLAFNPLDCPDPDKRPFVASGIVSAFKKLYGDSWGPRLEHILRNAALALTERPEASLLSMARLLGDAGYRRQVAASLQDPVVRAFWQREFAGWKPQLQAEAVAPVQNKIGQFLSNPILRGILGQSRSRLDLRRIMDDGGVLIVNLSKGRIGDDGSALLGSLLVTRLQLDAMSRAELPEHERRPFFTYVDEFQNFATDSFAIILSEARKYGLALTLANQYLDQLDDPTRAAVFGNVGSLIAFQVGANDAETLAEQLGGDVIAADLIALPRYTACVRLLVAGMPLRAFTMTTIPPDARAPAGRLPIIRRTSRHRYARPAAGVRQQIEAAYAVA
ncbi:MAG: DUF87 domain-containing protein [Planctomycetales bacterium]